MTVDVVEIEPSVTDAAATNSVLTGTSTAAFQEPVWSPLRRFLFRFMCVYVVLYVFPFPLSHLADPRIIGSTLVTFYYEHIGGPYYTGLDAATRWVGLHVFSVEVANVPSGSGDTLWNYVALALKGFASLVAASIWTLALMRSRITSHRWLAVSLIVLVRFYLFAVLLGYGFAKIAPSQFPFPRLNRFVTPIGEISPMGLVWLFMGFSPAYSVFAGLCETVGPILLLFRRTTTLGALLIVAVMSNVAMLNYAFDVPVKLFSTHLLVFAAGLVAIDARRLLRFFVLNRPVPPIEMRPAFGRPWLAWFALAVKLAFAGWVGYLQWNITADNRASYASRAAPAPLYGIHDVESFERDGVEVPPLTTSADRWRQLVIDDMKVAYIRTMDDRFVRASLVLDVDARTVRVNTTADDAEASTLTYTTPEPGILVFEGILDGKPVKVRMRRRDENQIPLLARGYHWVNEFPFHR